MVDESIPLTGACHCGAVAFRLLPRPRAIVECNCSICRRVAARWGHVTADALVLTAGAGTTDRYVQGDRQLAMHRCATCGCLTHWDSLDPAIDRAAANLRLCDPADVADLPIRELDGADSWTFLRDHVPPGWPDVVPRLAVAEPEAVIEFLQTVAGAAGEYHPDRPTELVIGNSLIMVAGTQARAPTQGFLYVYVPDTDTACDKARALGATVLEAPAEMPYGDRRATVADPWGNLWQFATHRGFAAADDA